MTSNNTTTIELQKEAMKFSVAHFTIFSATERERLHGHNYTVRCQITAGIDDNGMTFNYKYYKRRLIELCKFLNEYTLLAENSPHTQIEQTSSHCYVHFNHEVIPFLNKDVKLLPIRNITVEELARWFTLQISQDSQTQDDSVQQIDISIFSGPGQSGNSQWKQLS